MNRILVPLDGSDFSTQIVPGVKKLFPPGSCELVLYHVGAHHQGHTALPPHVASDQVDMQMYDSGSDYELARHPIYSSQADDTFLAEWKDGLEPLAESLRSAGYTVSTDADLGHAADAIIQRAHQDDIDLIAMTTHGRSGITRLLFGSVAEKVVQHTSVPVLLIRPSHQTEEELAPDA